MIKVLAPLETIKLTALPSLRCVPAAGSVRITDPDGTSSLFSSISLSTFKLTFSIAARASATVLPETSGIFLFEGVR